MIVDNQPGLGATCLQSGVCHFRAWAPRASRVEVRLLVPEERLLPLQSQPNGYFAAHLPGAPPGSLYFYHLDGGPDRPDPASRCQPRGVHGPSQVVSSHFDWTDGGWSGLPLSEYVLYELHVGTFSPEGTFDAVIGRLAELKQLGITAIELMPVAQFPGTRNWGYDGVYPFAVQHSYGGPAGLKRLVNACHALGLAVVLDVVYNHLGPEGNYLAEFGPYFTDQYRTPWGQAINFDGPDSDETRRYFLENARQWQADFHIDALRLDAVHAIRDFSATPFLAELAADTGRRAQRLNRRFYLIAESDLNDTRLIRRPEQGGLGLHAQWNDDFHHALHALLTGERTGYYEDFGAIEHLARAYRDGLVYAGDYSPHRRRRHGNSARDLPGRRFVVCIQNHDQVGNRMMGDRLSATVSFDSLKLAAAAVVLSPYLPMLFMGEEQGETAPFQYFTSHGDAALIEAVRAGRRAEFAAFRWQGDVPDPQDEATFLRSKLSGPQSESARTLREFYRELFRLRRTVPALANPDETDREVVGWERQRAVMARRRAGDDESLIVLHFGEETTELVLPVPAGTWMKALDSTDPRWRGSGARSPERFDGEALTIGPRAAVLYRRSV